jgi:hypothetical protein
MFFKIYGVHKDGLGSNLFLEKMLCNNHPPPGGAATPLFGGEIECHPTKNTYFIHDISHSPSSAKKSPPIRDPSHGK